MKRLVSIGLILVICLSLLSSEKSFGQSDVKTRLLKDVVKTENGRFTFQQFGFLVTIEVNILEVKITLTAPASLFDRLNESGSLVFLQLAGMTFKYPEYLINHINSYI